MLHLLPPADEILRVFGTVAQADKGAIFSPLIRLLLVGLVIWCVRRKKVYSELIAAYTGLLVMATGMMMIGFKESGILSMFFVIFPLGLLWGREALVFPSRPKYLPAHVWTAIAFAAVAFFYPYFVKGPGGPVLGTILLAPMGVLPAPSLIIAQAAIIATRRSYSLYTVIPTWVVGAAFGLFGVFYINKPIDLVLLAAVAVSVIVYVLSPVEEQKRKSKKLRRH